MNGPCTEQTEGTQGPLLRLSIVQDGTARAEVLLVLLQDGDLLPIPSGNFT